MTKIFDQISNSMTLSQEIVDKITSAIKSHELLPGEKLPPEPELCRMFNVSRTAVREALQILNARGLISIQKGRGTFINKYLSTHASDGIHLYLELNFDRDHILEIMKFRSLIEPDAAMLAAINRTELELVQLEENFQQFITNQNNPEITAELDLNFHLNIARLSHNQIIYMTMEPILKLLPKIKTLIVQKVKSLNKYTALTEHERVYQCIKNMDGHGAYLAMKSHMKVAENHARLLYAALDDSRIK